MIKMVNPGSMVDREQSLSKGKLRHVSTVSDAVRLSARRQIVVHVRWSPLARIALEEAFHGTEIVRGIFAGTDPDGRRWLVYVR